MTSALYLEHYLDGLENLPNEISRNFKLMRELDSRARIIMKNIDERANEFMKCLLKDKEVMSENYRQEKLQEIQDLFNKAKEYGDDKVQLAIQTYELVDKHIRRLDSDLARFEGDIQDKTISARGKSEETIAKSRKKGKDSKSIAKKKRANSSEDESKGSAGEGIGGGSSGTQTNKNRKQKVNQEKEARKGQKKSTDVEEVSRELSGHVTPHPSDVLDMPVDPNEPTYCLCHQVSYGEMIGCDNPDCPIEWFHFACVGLTIKPKGKWFCPKCKPKKK